MKFGDKIEGTIGGIAKDGSGLIQREIGKPIAVYNTIPGETVKATVVKRTKVAMRAQLDEVVTASPDRVAPRCPYAGTCGGCKWQHVDGARQLALKLDLVRGAFERAGQSCPINDVIPCPEPFYYRNRMDFVFGRNGEVGLKMPDRWWSVLDLETCFLLSPESAELVNRVRAFARASGLPFWDSRTQQGFFRYLVIREGKNTGERMVMLVTASPITHTLPTDAFVSAVGDFATSVVWGINPLVTDLSIAAELRPLKGDPWIHEEINGVRYKITPNAFFQTNSVMAAELQKMVCEFTAGWHRMGAPTDRPQRSEDEPGRGNPMTGPGRVLDLYCGSGFFSLAVAKQLKAEVTGIELDAEAIAAAKENATANALNAEYFVSRAEAYDWTSHNPDVVIVDPPRAGMHPDAIELLLKVRPPTIVYVSCSIERFVQEWVGALGHAGLSTAYRIADAKALDLFPHTPHVECVFRLERLT